MPDINVLIADDHPIVCKGIHELINKAIGISVVGEAASGLQTLQMIEELKPDVVLLDMEMPDINGVELLEAARQIDPVLFPGVSRPGPDRGGSCFPLSRDPLGQADDIGSLDPEFPKNGKGDAELPLAAVHHDQIGQILPVTVAPFQHLPQHRIVIGTLHISDPEMPVARLFGSSPGEGDHGPHGKLPADVGDVEALDPSGLPPQVKPFPEDLQGHLLGFEVPVCLEGVLGVSRGHSEHPASLPLLRPQDRDLLPLFFTQPLLDDVTILDLL